MKRLKIAYVSTYDPTNVAHWSGLGYYIAKTVEKYVGDIDFISNLDTKTYLHHNFLRYFYKLIFKEKVEMDRTMAVGKHYAKQIGMRLKEKCYDLIFSPSSIPVSYLETSIPIIFWADATFASMVDYYFHSLSKITIRSGHSTERAALKKCTLACYASDWAANSAINDYHTDPSKVKIIPFGANLEYIPEKEAVVRELSDPVQLLFVGRDWIRKGGEIAFDTLLALKEMGIKSLLTIVGCEPPGKCRNENVHVFPNLDKNNDNDSQKLTELYRNADFFILPSRQECYGVVFCEAAAFGVPVLATRIGGIPTIVNEGENGFLFTLEDRGIHFATKVKALKSDPAVYKGLRSSSRRRYDHLLNWNSAGETLAENIAEKLNHTNN